MTFDEFSEKVGDYDGNVGDFSQKVIYVRRLV